MARPSTGAWTTGEAIRIELSYMLKQKMIQKGRVLSFPMSWTNQHGKETGSIYCRSNYLGSFETNYLELSYTQTGSDGTKKEFKYKVYLYEQPSNLGKGKVLYFLCPVSGKRCRILYLAYGSEYFKARTSYRNRIYYSCQLSSRISCYNDNYWHLEGQLKKLKKIAKGGKRTYKRKLTKKAQRYNKLSSKQDRMDDLRWTIGVPKSLRSLVKAYGLTKDE